MNGTQYTTLMEAFDSIPDPRKARGKRYPLAYLLALISAAMAAGQKAGRGIAQWIGFHASEVIEYLDPPRESMPSASTICRIIRDIDAEVLEQAVSILVLAQGSGKLAITMSSSSLVNVDKTSGHSSARAGFSR